MGGWFVRTTFHFFYKMFGRQSIVYKVSHSFFVFYLIAPHFYYLQFRYSFQHVTNLKVFLHILLSRNTDLGVIYTANTLYRLYIGSILIGNKGRYLYGLVQYCREKFFIIQGVEVYAIYKVKVYVKLEPWEKRNADIRQFNKQMMLSLHMV